MILKKTTLSKKAGIKSPEKPENLRARTQSLRDRRRAQGLVRIEFWLKKEWVNKVKKYIDKLKKPRQTYSTDN